jgi:ATP-dependent phosphofructokinase / diphosphate-dependent phosphofructokinase
MPEIHTIGILTGGGDCPGLNAVIRAAVRTALGKGMTVKGIQNGFQGLVEDRIITLHDKDVSGILPLGGTILGTTNKDNPFHYKVEENGKYVFRDMSDRVLENLKNNGIQALVLIGGDGTHACALELEKKGVKIIGVPKTIDNDIPCTERTFGFDSAVGVASWALDRLHTTAESHHRVMLLEVMGRYAGWIALHSGMAGGADIILIPEIPFSMDVIIRKVRDRVDHGKRFSIIVVSEGAVPIGGEMTVKRIVEDSPEKIRLGGVGEKLANEIEKRTEIETRCTVLGHLQRGGTPTAYDRVLATRYGVAAVDCICRGEFGRMVALQKNQITSVPISDVVGMPHNVAPDDQLVQAARAIGVSFGDN